MKDKEPIIPEINTHDVKKLNLRFQKIDILAKKSLMKLKNHFRCSKLGLLNFSKFDT